MRIRGKQSEHRDGAAEKRAAAQDSPRRARPHPRGPRPHRRHAERHPAAARSLTDENVDLRGVPVDELSALSAHGTSFAADEEERIRGEIAKCAYDVLKRDYELVADLVEFQKTLYNMDWSVMEILLVNDDGFDAPGIQVLYRVLSASDGFEVAVCTP